MAAIAHMVLTAGIDKGLSWVTKPPLVLGEGGVTDIIVTWPAALTGWNKYVEIKTSVAVPVTIDGVPSISDEIRLNYSDGMVLEAPIITGQPLRIWAVAVNGTEVYKSLPLDMPPCQDGITSTTDPAVIGISALTAHLLDETDAHDASAISIADGGSLLTSTDVEGALQEVAALIGDTATALEIIVGN